MLQIHGYLPSDEQISYRPPGKAENGVMAQNTKIAIEDFNGNKLWASPAGDIFERHDIMATVIQFIDEMYETCC